MPVRKTVGLPLRSTNVSVAGLQRMAALAGAVGTVIVRDRGPMELLKRLSDPFWFQAFGSVVGLDWHSSNITATLCGALREATKRRANDMGIVVCGSKVMAARKTFEQIQQACDRSGDPAESLAYASRMTVKVDSAAVQDGYELHSHCFLFVPGTGAWAVVQQGTNSDARYARRYHWFSETMRSYVNDPHAAVACDKHVNTLNLVAGEADRHRQALTALSREHPDRIMRELRPLLKQRTQSNGHAPRHHGSHTRLATRLGLRPRDLNPASLKKILLGTYERQATEFEQLLGEPGVGAHTLRSLSLIAELVYSAPASHRDPAAHGFAHGSRDNQPYRLNRALYDPSIERLRDAIERTKVGPADKVKALKALAGFMAKM